MNTELPARLSDVKSPEVIDVDLADKVVLEEDAIRALQSQGCAVLGQKCLSDLQMIGQYVRGVGVLRHQRGRAIVTQQKLDQVLGKVLEMLANGKEDSKGRNKKLSPGDIQKLAQAASSLATASTKSQQFMLEVERLAKPSKNDDAQQQPTQKPFLANSDVKPPSSGTLIIAQTVNQQAPS